MENTDNCFTFTRTVCERCAGKCCSERLYVTKHEYDSLSKEHKEIFSCVTNTAL